MRDLMRDGGAAGASTRRGAVAQALRVRLAAMNAAEVEYPGYSGIAEGERRGGAEDAPEVEKQTSNR